MRLFLFLVTFTIPLLSFAAPQDVEQYTWVVLGPHSKPIARTIVSKTQPCPNITIDNKKYLMQIRAEADNDFAVRSCEYTLPKKTKTASINGKALALPPQQLERIVIIGDTGCRLKGFRLQNCDKPNTWPFPQLAQHIADLEPDLVIHVGDYHYRETACPQWKKGCQQSPSGYGWDSWEADFFKPAKPLLENTPWIMVRGNHEECKRAGSGWDRLLAPTPFSKSCSDYNSPYAVQIGNQQFLIFDSSKASLFVKKEQQKIYQKQFQAMNAMASNNVPTWLLLHHPIWAFYKTNLGPSVSQTDSLQAAIGPSEFPSSVKLIVSGHIHLNGWLRFDNTDKNNSSARPSQLIAGNGGTKLVNPPVDFSSYKGKELDGKIIQDAFSSNEFGYLLVVRQIDKKGNKQWLITSHRLDGSIINQFDMSA
jgi:hypothetical protein